MAKEILINQLFAGRYLEEGENIGHEVINLFKDDNGNNNIYVTPSGSVNGHDLEYILFVRNISKRTTVEVIGVAKNIQKISDEEVNDIQYAGVSLDRIFNTNSYRGETDISTQHVTYRAREFYLPSMPIFITIDKGYEVKKQAYTLSLNSTRQVVIPQGMRMYYSETNDLSAFSQLKELIENDDLWDDSKTTEKLFPDGSVYNQSPSFLEVIRKEDDENIFSNLFAYYFEYSHRAFQRFAADVLNIPDMSMSFELFRETKYRTDIWIESEEDIIVIENKINSGINGIKDDDTSQLNHYYQEAEKEAESKNKKTHYYIFAPNYASLDISKYGMKDIYTIIEYSKIYNYYIHESEVYLADRAYPDFIRGLKRHTLSLPDLQFNTMRSRLLRKINLLQQYGGGSMYKPNKSEIKNTKVTINDVANEIEKLVISSDERIKTSPMDLILRVCNERFRITDIDQEIESFGETDVIFAIYDLLVEKSKDKSNSFSMRLAPEKEERWGKPYVFDYILKKG